MVQCINDLKIPEVFFAVLHFSKVFVDLGQLFSPQYYTFFNQKTQISFLNLAHNSVVMSKIYHSLKKFHMYKVH